MAGPGVAAVGTVQRIFRNWNLDNCWVVEWQRIFGGRVDLAAANDDAAARADMRVPGAYVSAEPAGAAQ